MTKTETPVHPIRIRRQRLALSEQDLAELCGLSRRTILRIETGSRWPRMETIRAIAAGLGIQAMTLTKEMEQWREAIGKGASDEGPTH